MAQRPLKTGVIFGGMSAEHEVSWRSAKNVVLALDPGRYQALPILIDKQGRWFSIDKEELLSDDSSPHRAVPDGRARILLGPDEGKLAVIDQGSGRTLEKLDVVFPVLHGPHGEDGTLQGLCKIFQVPFVGPGVLASAVCMDKEVMKRLLVEQGIPTPKFLVFRTGALRARDLEAVGRKLGYPVFVKPANLGSSVGISKVKSARSLPKALSYALKFDAKALVEEFVEGREVECSVLGNERPAASIPGEIVPAGRHGFYSYEAKYSDPDGADLLIPAQLPPQVVAAVRSLAVRSFVALGCEGMARADFFVRQDGTVLVNELNTIPGFTNISMYPKLWEASGISCRELVHRLIKLALARARRDAALSRSFDEPRR
ncbi:MAG: D-alanine--D-alanine ligase family protein [bacterium]